MYTRVKICGITRPDDALAAARAGADAIGLVFYEPSPRNVTIDQAQLIARVLPPFVTVVGLFVDAPVERVEEVVGQVPLNLLQFHGREPAEACRRYRLPYIKAIRMQEGVDVHALDAAYADAAGLLLDSFVADVAGGSGATFDWSRVPRDLKRPVILSGGLTAENVSKAVHNVHPFAVDVSSGVEKTRGVKDADRIGAFMRAVREVREN